MNEPRMRQPDARFGGLLDAMPDAIVVVNALGRIVLVNGATERLFGYARGELLGKPVEALVPERYQDAHARHRSGYVAAPHRRGLDAGLALYDRRRDGTEFPIDISLSLLDTPDGGLVVGAIRDITERKRLEAERDEQSRRAEEASRLKSEFLANMSHELRTPLSGIIGFAELIHDGKVGRVSDEQKEYLGDILTSSHHEAGRMDFHPEVVDLERGVREVRDPLRALSAQKRIQIRSAIDPALAEVVAGPAKLKQVLYNYLSNALEFTPEEGRIAIRLSAQDAAAFRIEVEDSGIGIEPGTGFGRALTRRVVEPQGGRGRRALGPGQGSVFHAMLPRRAS